jgi:hypothetical protein
MGSSATTMPDCAMPDACSTPAGKLASQARCAGLAGPTMRLSNSTSSSENGADFATAAKKEEETCR